MVKYSINLAVFMAFHRYAEKQADDGISDNIAVLTALKKDMENEMCFPSDKPLYDYIFFQPHPSHGDRFERFTRRIRKLKFEETKKEYNKV